MRVLTLVSLQTPTPPAVDLAPCTAAAVDPAVAPVPNPVCATLLELTDGRFPAVARLGGAVVVPVARILLILVLAWVVNRLVRRVIRRFVVGLTEVGIQRLGALTQRAPLAESQPIDLQRALMRTETVGGVLRGIAGFAIWTIAAFLILGALGIQLGPLIAGAGIAGVALGFGAQSLVKDFLSGIFLLLEDQYGIGDIVDTGVAPSGTVEEITLRSTRLRDVEGTVWHIPNGEIRRVGNSSQQWARSLIDVGVAYGSDLEHVKTVLKRVADELWQDEEYRDDVLEEPEIWGLERFDADQLTIRMVLKVSPAKQFRINRELRARIKSAFDAEGIEIPFPQRTVWVRGDGGGALPMPTAPVTSAKQSGDGGDTAGT